MRTLFYCALIAIVFWGCAPRQGSVVTLDSSNIREYPGKSFFPDFIEDWDFIKFETSDKSLIANVINAEFEDGKIFVATRPPLYGYWDNNQLKVFNDNGEYLYDIGSQGRGPEEFLNIQSFRLDKKNKYAVIRDNNRRMFIFDYIGNFINRIDTDTEGAEWPFSFYYLPDGNILLYHHMVPMGNMSTYIVADANFKPIARLDTVIYNSPNPDRYSTNTSRHPVAINGDDVVLLKDLCDTVFVYSGEKLIPVCYLSSYGTLPSGVVKSDVATNLSRIEKLMNPDIVKSVYVTSEHVLIYENENLLVLDKSFDKGVEIKVLPEKVTSVPIGKTPREPYYRIDGVHDNMLYAWIQAIDLVEYREQCEEAGMELSEKQKALFSGLKEDDNPVLVFYKMRKRPV